MCFRVFEPVTWAPPTPTSEPSSYFKITKLLLDYSPLQNILPRQDERYMMKYLSRRSVYTSDRTAYAWWHKQNVSPVAVLESQGD